MQYIKFKKRGNPVNTQCKIDYKECDKRFVG